MTEENEAGIPNPFEDSDGEERENTSDGSQEVELVDVESVDASAEAILGELFLSPDSEPIEEPSSEPAASNGLGERVAELEAERDDYKNRLLRTAADLENFRKRAAREREDMRKYGIDRVVLELLPAIDNLERALEHAEKSESGANITEGVRMVARQFFSSLEKHGVVQFDARGDMFDPQQHEAIQQVETHEHETGTVLEQYQRGYFLHDRLLRPAMVAVAKKVEPTEEVAKSAESTEDEDSENEVVIELISELAEGSSSEETPEESLN